MPRRRHEVSSLSGQFTEWTELNPGHVHLDQIAGRVREGLKKVGLTPFGFNTIAPCDGMSEGHEGMHHILPAREVIADSVEIMAKVNRLDGLVLIGSCDKIIPGLLMAAARVDVPSIMITGGYHLPTVILTRRLQRKLSSPTTKPGSSPLPGTKGRSPRRSSGRRSRVL